MHFTRIARALFKFRRSLYCITWTEGASLCATINFPEKQNHFQPNQPQVNVRPQGLKRPAGTRDTGLSPPGLLGPRSRRAPAPGSGRPTHVKEELQRTSESPKAISRGL